MHEPPTQLLGGGGGERSLMALDDDEVTCVKSFVLLPSDLQRSSSKDVFKGQMCGETC